MPRTPMLVLDASVLVELTVAGSHREGADRILDAWGSTGGLVMVSAAHALVEAAGALRRLVRQGELAVGDGARAVRWLASMDLILDASAPRLDRLWELRDRMSAYDAAYAAAAEAFDVPLVSVDRRLIAACGQAGIAAVDLDEWRADGLPARGP